MDLSNFHRALLRGIVAGAVVVAGTAACSRSDRADSGRDNTAAVLPDTASDNAAGSAAAGTGTESAAAAAAAGDTTSSSDTVSARSNTPRASTAPADEPAAGYREMQRDTASTEISVEADSTGYTEMARDTSTTPEQIDTIAQAEPADTVAQPAGDVALQARVDTVGADTSVAVSADVSAAAESDTAVIVGDAEADTTAEMPTEVAVASTPDTVTVVGDSSSVDKPGPRAKEDTISTKADSLAEYHEAERVRDIGDASVSEEDREAVAAAEAPADEVGAAAIGGNVTGADAWAGMTRQGAQCIVVDSESAQSVMWDMTNTPATLNPCGLGSMTPSRIWTKWE